MAPLLAFGLVLNDRYLQTRHNEHFYLLSGSIQNFTKISCQLIVTDKDNKGEKTYELLTRHKII